MQANTFGTGFAPNLGLKRLFAPLVFGLVLVGSIVTLCASPPPNDNFTNRIVLIGHSNSFSATLAEATMEPDELPLDFPFGGTGPWASVWWSWTASDSGPVIFQIREFSPFLPHNQYTPIINIFPGRDPNLGYPSYKNSPWQRVASIQLATQFVVPSITFTSVPGATYWIQLGGTPDVTAKFALIATNSPILAQQPATQTASPGGKALLTVVADGLRPFGYQWRFNGADLTGETSPMLALTNVSVAQAGGYSVIVSNSTGAATSEVAQIYVDSEELRPRLAPLAVSASATFGFSVTGQTGRYYRIEASSNLFAWAEEKIFPMLPWNLSNSTSVIRTAEGLASLSVPAILNAKFIRAWRYASSNELCNLYLKELRFAKDLWARDLHMRWDDTPQPSILQSYYKSNHLDHCPVGGRVLCPKRRGNSPGLFNTGPYSRGTPLRACFKSPRTRRVRARGLHETAGNRLLCRPGPLIGRFLKHALRAICPRPESAAPGK